MNPPAPTSVLTKLFGRFMPNLAQYAELTAQAQVPLATLRAVSPHSQGVRVSPLAHQALLMLASSRVTRARLQGMSLAISKMGHADFQAQELGPWTELGLVTLALQLPGASSDWQHANGVERNWATKVKAAEIGADRLWQAALASQHVLQHGALLPSGKVILDGTTLVQAWAQQTRLGPYLPPPHLETAATWLLPVLDSHPQTAHRLLLDSTRDDALLALAERAPDPAEMAQCLGRWLDYADTAVSQADSDEGVDEDRLITARQVLAARLGRPVPPLDWTYPDRIAHLPRLYAAHRQAEVASQVAPGLSRPRRRM